MQRASGGRTVEPADELAVIGRHSSLVS
jgi:hypothetical protein